jgi:hypothetical protein
MPAGVAPYWQEKFFARDALNRKDAKLAKSYRAPLFGSGWT